MIRTKDDIDIYYDGSHLPSVNVKVYRSTDSVKLPIHLGSSYPVGFPEMLQEHWTEDDFTHEWIDSILESESGEWVFVEACESQFEQAEVDAEEIFGKGVSLSLRGRSGGHLCVDGLPPVESWDAIMLSKWKKFVNYCDDLVKYVPEVMVELIYMNHFEPWYEEKKAKEELLNNIEEGVYG